MTTNDDTPAKISAAVDDWRPLVNKAHDLGLPPSYATELLTAHRYDTLLDRVARLEAAVHYPPVGRSRRDALIDHVKNEVESRAIRAATAVLDVQLSELEQTLATHSRIVDNPEGT